MCSCSTQVGWGADTLLEVSENVLSENRVSSAFSPKRPLGNLKLLTVAALTLNWNGGAVSMSSARDNKVWGRTGEGSGKHECDQKHSVHL